MVFGIYKHYKGKYYLVLTKSANNAEELDDNELEDNKLEDTYIYLALYKTPKFKRFKIWHRRASDFEVRVCKKILREGIKLTTLKYRKLTLWETVKYLCGVR